MSQTAQIGLHDAARSLGVSVRALRHAVRAARIPAPPSLSAVAPVPADWLARVEAAVAEQPTALGSGHVQKVPPFARYEGTSAWRKYGRRVRDYAAYRAAIAQGAPGN